MKIFYEIVLWYTVSQKHRNNYYFLSHHYFIIEDLNVSADSNVNILKSHACVQIFSSKS
jgi:hypothetical protein